MSAEVSHIDAGKHRQDASVGLVAALFDLNETFEAADTTLTGHHFGHLDTNRPLESKVSAAVGTQVV